MIACFLTKETHLEATSDLSTSTFLAAFQIFVFSRGFPAYIYADNYTKFVGASKALAKEFIQAVTVTSNYCAQNLSWHIISLWALHMGELWESGFKKFEKAIQKVTFEDFLALLSRIEACLIPRPLSPIFSEPTTLPFNSIF